MRLSNCVGHWFRRFALFEEEEGGQHGKNDMKCSVVLLDVLLGDILWSVHDIVSIKVGKCVASAAVKPIQDPLANLTPINS